MVAPMKIQNGGSGGTVVCLGVGGLVDMSSVLGLDAEGDGEDPSGGVEVWLIDARRPWNLGNVFGGNPRDMLGGVDGNARSRKPEVERGKLLPIYRPGQGGIIVYDDGDIDEELSAEREAYCALTEMAKAGIDDDYESDLSDGDSNIIESIETIKPTSKRKMPTDTNDSEASDSENQRPRQKRRRNSVRERILISLEMMLMLMLYSVTRARHLHRFHLKMILQDIVQILGCHLSTKRLRHPHRHFKPSKHRSVLFDENSIMNVGGIIKHFTSTMRLAPHIPSLYLLFSTHWLKL